MLSATAGAAVGEIAETDRETFLRNISLTLLSSEPEKDKIDCFDVNAEGLIAVGTVDGEGAKVLVYDEGGAFQYGYSFRAKQYFDIAWEGADIAIYFARSNMVASFDRHGNNTALHSVDRNSQIEEFWNTRFTAKKQCVLNGKTYELRTGLGILSFAATGYSRLVIIDATGQEHILYDVSARYRVIVLSCIIALLLFVTIVIRTIIRSATKQKRPSDS